MGLIYRYWITSSFHKASPKLKTNNKISGDILKTPPNFKRITRQRNLAALTALLLMAGITATAASSADAASTTYVCVNKTTSLVYFKTKCAKTERRVAINTVTNGTNGTDGSAGAIGLTGPAGATGATGAIGPAGSSASLPFFQRLESGLTCDEKWRAVTISVYANNQTDVDRQQALAGCAQPDWAKQYFQFPDANPITLVSTTYGTPTLANQQIRRNNVLVDDLYAPKKNTVTGSISVTDTEQLRTSFYDLWLNTYICGPDASTPSGLGQKLASANLFLPAVNP